MYVEKLRLEERVLVDLGQRVHEIDDLRDHLSREGREHVIKLLLVVIDAAQPEARLHVSEPGAGSRGSERGQLDVSRLRRMILSQGGTSVGSTSAIVQSTRSHHCYVWE